MEDYQYSYPGEYYDSLMENVNYNLWKKFACKSIKKFGKGKYKTVLDLACGTGSLSELFCKDGYDVTCVDSSLEMLQQAREKLSEYKEIPPLILNQDMRDFELNDVVDLTVCALDSINYILEKEDLKRMMKRVGLFMRPGGLFVFDMNTPNKFSKFYANNDFVIENDGILCAWQNYYDKQSKICEFNLSFFKENKKGDYSRYDEVEYERCYSMTEIRRLLSVTGFDVCGFFSGDKFDSFLPATSKDNRWMVVAKRREDLPSKYYL